jgi:cullin 1
VKPALSIKHDEALLQALADAWENHQLMDRWMSKFFRYLNKAFVDTKNVPSLQQVAVTAFKECLFASVQGEIVRALTCLINKEREVRARGLRTRRERGWGHGLGALACARFLRLQRV